MSRLVKKLSKLLHQNPSYNGSQKEEVSQKAGEKSEIQINEDSSTETSVNINDKKMEKKNESEALKNKGKLFIGGLSYSTTSKGLGEYFSQYGKVVDSVVIRHPESKKSRGFGFVLFADPAAIETVLKIKEHVLDGKTIDPTPFTQDHAPKTKETSHRVFLGGLTPQITEEFLKDVFTRYGEVKNVIIPRDKNTNKPRDFGFIVFKYKEAAEKCISESFIYLKGNRVFIKKALPRDPEPTSNRPLIETGYDFASSLNVSSENFADIMDDASSSDSVSGNTLSSDAEDLLEKLLEVHLREITKPKVKTEPDNGDDVEKSKSMLTRCLENENLIIFSDESDDETDQDTDPSEKSLESSDEFNEEFDEETFNHQYVQKQNDFENKTRQKSDNFELKDRNGLLYCSLCNWAPPNNSFEFFLSHCKTLKHRTKLKERFTKNGSQISEIVEQTRNVTRTSEINEIIESLNSLSKSTHEKSFVNFQQESVFCPLKEQSQASKKGKEKAPIPQKQPQTSKKEKESAPKQQKQPQTSRKEKENAPIPQKQPQTSKKEKESAPKQQKQPQELQKEGKGSLESLNKKVLNKTARKKKEKSQESDKKSNLPEKESSAYKSKNFKILANKINCIQLLSEKQLKCEICNKLIPAASEFGALMRNVSIHLQSKGHLNKLLQEENSVITKEEKKTKGTNTNKQIQAKKSMGNSSKEKNVTNKPGTMANTNKETMKNEIFHKEKHLKKNEIPIEKIETKNTIKTETATFKNEITNDPNKTFLCVPCNFFLNTIEKFQAHLNSKSHLDCFINKDLSTGFLRSYLCNCKSCERILYGSLFYINKHYSVCMKNKKL